MSKCPRLALKIVNYQCDLQPTFPASSSTTF